MKHRPLSIVILPALFVGATATAQPAPQKLKPITQAKPAAAEQQQNRQDSASDLTQERALKMQAYQERSAKANSAMSNTLKKNSDTSAGIIGNVK